MRKSSALSNARFFHSRTPGEFVTEAVQGKLSVPKGTSSATPAWMEFFGSVKKHTASLRGMDAMGEREE